MKYGLALSGGGFKGALQLSVLEVLMTDQYDLSGNLIHKAIKWDAVSGISVGALNAAYVAMDDIAGLKKMWDSTKDSQGGIITNGKLGDIKEGKLVLNFDRILGAVKQGVGFGDVVKGIFSRKGKESIGNEVAKNFNNLDSILDNTPLANLLRDNISLDKIKVDFYGIGLTSLESGLNYKLSHKDFYNNEDFVRAVLASATMPVIWKPVDTIRTRKGTIGFGVDGGVRTISPSGQIFDQMEEGEDWTIYFINCNSQLLPIAPDNTWNLTSSGGRSLDMMLNQISVNDTTQAIYFNDNAEYLNMNPNRKKKIKKATIKIIEPASGQSGETLDARPDIIDFRYNLGRELALESIRNSIQ